MGKSVKIAITGFLVAFMFAGRFYFEAGLVMIPYPLFSFILLGVLLVQLFQDKTQYIQYLPLGALILLRCLSNPLTFTFFMNEADFDALSQGMAFDLLAVLEMLATLLVVAFAIGFDEMHQKITVLCLYLGFFGLYALPYPMLRSGFFGLLALVAVVSSRRHATLPTLILLAVFDILEAYGILY